MRLTFGEKLLIEQVRAMDEAGALAPVKPHTNIPVADFESLLLQRARLLIEHHDVKERITHAAKLSKWFSLLLLAIAAGAGALAILQAIDSLATTLNIYWLMLVLLGFNFVSLALWLIGVVYFQVSTTSQSVLHSLWRKFESSLNQSETGQHSANKAWFSACYQHATGRWRLSALGHALWLSYLMSACFVLLLLLMTRQFDFIWATTILSSDVFVMITQALSAPLNLLGINTPSIEEITASQHGGDYHAAKQLRQVWATFLLGTLVLYGVTPRLLLLFVSKLLEHLSRQRYQLDLNLPYYIGLRHQLMPGSSKGRIVDPDSNTPCQHVNQIHSLNPAPIPPHARWIALELSAQTRWPLHQVNQDLGHVTGATSLQRILARLENTANDTPLIIAVSINRLVDRGLNRTLTKLYATSSPKQRWLAIIDSNDSNTRLMADRLKCWRHVAETFAVPSTHLTILQSDSHD